jgi:hypothetical protein
MARFRFPTCGSSMKTIAAMFAVSTSKSRQRMKSSAMSRVRMYSVECARRKRTLSLDADLVEVSDGYVPLHSLLAGHLRAWQCQTPHANESDFVFPSFRAKGRKPLCSSVFVADLRPAAKESRSTHRGRPTVRTSQFASQLKQLAGEQNESRTKNRSANLAS